MHYENSNSRSPNRRLAAVFVDYDNLFALLRDKLDSGAKASTYISEVLSELRRYLLDADRTKVATNYAYADFSALSEDRSAVEQKLFAHGTEPRFVPSHLQPNASELQLCVDAVDMLHRRKDLETFVIVTGDRGYYPLVHMLKGYGYDVLVVALEVPSSEEAAQPESDVFLDMLNLLSESARRELMNKVQRDAPYEHTYTARQYTRLSNRISIRTLEVAEQYFGQYEEIYLTPLLRKLSEVLGPDYDPKSIISDLEDAGAVRLEKREGYPYDYTVLIVNEDHPDVQEVYDRYYSGDSRYETYEDGYAEEAYEDETEEPDDVDVASAQEYGYEEDSVAEDSYDYDQDSAADQPIDARRSQEADEVVEEAVQDLQDDYADPTDEQDYWDEEER